MRFLIGPTAVGKTDVSIRWATQNNAEIICADAPLIYKGMDIGAAKPTAQEQLEVAHHALDWVDVTQNFSVGDYALRVKTIVEDIQSRGKNILIVGGSGFYLKSYFSPVVDGIELKAEVVAEVAELFEKEGLDGLVDRLKGIDADLEGLDCNNPRRVIKALERALSAGLSYRQLKDRFDALPAPYADFDKHVTMLTRDKEHLRERIARRVDLMLASGLIDEVKALKEKGIENNSQAATVIDYREVLAYLANPAMGMDSLKKLMIDNTLELMRKQFIFFKQLPITSTILLDANEPASPQMLF